MGCNPVLEMEKRKGSIDMISGLSDEILYHILSFLPTKLCVSTSILAKRWRFLWNQVPNLEFYGLNFKGDFKTQHLDIISRVMMLHESKIVNAFKLFNVKVCAYQLETLLIYPIKRSVRNVYLYFSVKNKGDIACTVPRLLFTCKTLVDLELVNCGVIPSSGELFLPSLKKLNLSYVQYEDGASLPRLLSGCPVLEELTIDYRFRTEEKNPGCFIVSSPTIKKLNVESSDGLAHCSDVMLIIDVPALKYLKMNHCHLDRVRSLRKTMTSLIEAEMMVNSDCGSTDFFSCLCHVRRLNISSYFGETLVDIVGTGSMPKFVHLTKLCIGYIVNWYNVVKFLEVADNLEDLSIILFKTTPYKEPKRVPTCLLSCLRTVTVCYLNPCEDSFDIVRYILRNAQVLERMEVFYSASDKEKFDAVPSISMIERVSKSCQVYFFKN